MTTPLTEAGIRLYKDHLIVEKSGDGWIASYRLLPMAGSSGKLETMEAAIRWLQKNVIQVRNPKAHLFDVDGFCRACGADDQEQEGREPCRASR